MGENIIVCPAHTWKLAQNVTALHCSVKLYTVELPEDTAVYIRAHSREGSGKVKQSITLTNPIEPGLSFNQRCNQFNNKLLFFPISFKMPFLLNG